MLKFPICDLESQAVSSFIQSLIMCTRKRSLLVGFILLISCNLLFLCYQVAHTNLSPRQHVQLIDDIQDEASQEINRFPWSTNDSAFECLGWRQTSDCDPNGIREEQNDKGCGEEIRGGISGYCEVRNITSGKIFHTIVSTCKGLRGHAAFTCNMAKDFMDYSIVATTYQHTPTAVVPTETKAEPTKGIVMAVYLNILPGAYAVIKQIRSYGCNLPIELWYKPDEVQPTHPILVELVNNFNAVLKKIDDPRAYRFFVKPYAVYYSDFDNVLLLDADNFPVRDPTYLFDEPIFKEKGAIFWPDFWRPANTMFQLTKESVLWELTGIAYVDMFEQESGQVLINRRQHTAALEVLIFYAMHEPRLLTDMKLVWGDKDLFRFAWLKSSSTFHMIERPPGSLGIHHPTKAMYCGLSMVQYDVEGEILFFHRNHAKLHSDTEASLSWTHLQEFERNENIDDYFIEYWDGNEDFGTYCFGRRYYVGTKYNVTPMNETKFIGLETRLLEHIKVVNALT